MRFVLSAKCRRCIYADPLNLISGSTGLVGAVDGVFVLEKHKRVGNAARLTIANRDTKSHQFEFCFDSSLSRWKFVSDTNEDECGSEDDLLFIMLDCLLDEHISTKADRQ